MDAVVTLVDNLLEARRKKTQKSKAKPTAPVTPASPPPSEEELSNFVMQSFEQGPMLRLLALSEQHDIVISGRVERTSHHYVHENSTSFTLNVEYSQDVPPEVEAWVDANVNDIEKAISEKIIEINRKIYRALEREWDYRLSDEAVDEDIRANEYTFDEDGARDETGGFQFDQLSADAKKTARDWFREGIYSGGDNFWSEYIIEEWTEELAKMGFGDGTHEEWRNRQRVQEADPEISWSGFSSQGDGASFTTRHFDFEKYVNYFVTGQDHVEGPMSDEERAAARRAQGLPESEEDEVDDQISQMVRSVAFNDYSQILDFDDRSQWEGGKPRYDKHYHSRYHTPDTKGWADLNFWVTGPDEGPERVKVDLKAVLWGDIAAKEQGSIHRVVGFYVPQGRRGELLARFSDFWENTKGIMQRRTSDGRLPKPPQKIVNSMAYSLSRLAGVWKKEHTVQRQAANKAAVDKMIADDPEGFRRAAERVRGRLPRQEADEDAMMSRITSRTMAETFPYESFMRDISQKFWAGGSKQYRWSGESSNWTIQVYVTMWVNDPEQKWEISVDLKHHATGRRWRNDLLLSTEEEKANLGPQAKELVDQCRELVKDTLQNSYDSEAKKQGFLNTVSDIFNRIFHTQGVLIEM